MAGRKPTERKEKAEALPLPGGGTRALRLTAHEAERTLALAAATLRAAVPEACGVTSPEYAEAVALARWMETAAADLRLALAFFDGSPDASALRTGEPIGAR